MFTRTRLHRHAAGTVRFQVTHPYCVPLHATQAAPAPAYPRSVRHVAFSANDAYLLTVGTKQDGTVAVWNWRSGTRLASYRPPFPVK